VVTLSLFKTLVYLLALFLWCGGKKVVFLSGESSGDARFYHGLPFSRGGFLGDFPGLAEEVFAKVAAVFLTLQ
jgi:hypothetical protein